MTDLLDYPEEGLVRLETDLSACGWCGADIQDRHHELTRMTGRLLAERTTLVHLELQIEVFCGPECANAWLADTGISIESPGATDIARCVLCGAAVNRHALHESLWIQDFAGKDVKAEQCLGILCNDCVASGGEPDGDGGLPLPIAA